MSRIDMIFQLTLPHNKILNLSKLEALADKKNKCNRKFEIFLL